MFSTIGLLGVSGRKDLSEGVQLKPSFSNVFALYSNPALAFSHKKVSGSNVKTCFISHSIIASFMIFAYK